MPALQHLDVRDNVGNNSSEGRGGFSGTIPASWARTRSALVNLALQDNWLSGALPAGESLSHHVMNFNDIGRTSTGRVHGCRQCSGTLAFKVLGLQVANTCADQALSSFIDKLKAH